jgi:uncharacterized membrane protein
MRGNVIGFDPDTNAGAISGHDGNRYDFVRLEWRVPTRPVRGTIVEFIPVGIQATQIYPFGPPYDPGEGETAKIVYILYLLSLIVGVTGIIGVIIAYVNHADSPEWVKNNYRFQIRTFWIALLYALISVVTAIIVVGILFGLFTFIWWIVRSAKGLQRLSRGEPYENPATWLW